MNRIALAAAYLALWLCGCSTLSGDFHQKLQIDALDAQNRPVEGLRCEVGSGTSAQTFVTPATDVRVRRSALPLAIECRRDSLVASATVKPRRERMEEALLPFGSVGVFVDHLSGSLYAYPTTLHLRVGQHLDLEHGGDAQVAKSEAIPIAASPPATVARVELATVDPTPAVKAPGTVPAAAAPRKAAAAAPRADRAAAKPVKTAAIAAAPTMARTTAGTAAAAPTTARTTAGTGAAASTMARATVSAGTTTAQSAPVNW